MAGKRVGLLLAVMKCKQTTNVGQVGQLESPLKKFEDLYFDSYSP